MTFKKQIEEANAAKAAETEAAEKEQVTKSVELNAIAERLEQHLVAQAPVEVGLEMKREGARMHLKSAECTIVIESGFREYSGMVLTGEPPQTVRGSRQALATLDDVDAYILGVLQTK